ncbi:hypothetical protein BU15DRAFT_82778 [Melanogaster broomeanus]|nr:hypothetical protein BU15DRAFT_82778 [Melanogaster broomeanus]
MASGSRTGSNTNTSPSALDLHEAEEFRSTVWGNNEVFKMSQTVDVNGKRHAFDYLDFGNHLPALKTVCGLMDSRFMVVREEYRLAMKALEEAEIYRKGAAVLGQPGIGKTYFLIYALVERLRKERPTAFQSHPQTYFLFTEKGVTTHSTDDAEPLKLWHGIWALSDSNLVTISPAVVFLEAPSVCTIQATSPDAKHWKEWTKQYKAHRYIMDNWTSEELSVLAILSGLQIERMRHLEKKWGPSPRQLLEIGNNEEMESTFQEDIDTAASYFVSNVGQVIDSLRSLDFPLGKSGPSSVAFIKPKRDGPDRVLRMRCEAFVPTTRIEHSIAKALLKRDAITRSQFFQGDK